jgi:hypothetical protein
MLEELRKLLSGKTVLIHRDRGHGFWVEKRGVCTMVHKTESGFDIELIDGTRFEITPSEVTLTSVVGTTSGWSTIRRKIEVVL